LTILDLNLNEIVQTNNIDIINWDKSNNFYCLGRKLGWQFNPYPNHS